MQHKYPHYGWLIHDVDAKNEIYALSGHLSIQHLIHHLPNTLPVGGLGFSSTVSPPDRTPLKTDGATFPMRSTTDKNRFVFLYLSMHYIKTGLLSLTKSIKDQLWRKLSFIARTSTCGAGLLTAVKQGVSREARFSRYIFSVDIFHYFHVDGWHVFCCRMQSSERTNGEPSYIAKWSETPI